MKKTLAIALAVIFVLAFATPAFAQLTHNATYKADGTISLTKQVGHLCNTGAQMNQNISGQGTLEKVMNTRQERWKLVVDDSNDITTAPDAVNNLTVSSGLILCAPAKHEVTATDRVYITEETLDHCPRVAGLLGLTDFYLTENVTTYIPDAPEGYADDWSNITFRDLLMDAVDDAEWRAVVANLPAAELEGFAAAHGVLPTYTTKNYRALTSQIWAASVEANPGESATLNQDFTAAYGPGPGAADHQWNWAEVAPGFVVPRAGDDFVGNYFNITQLAQVTDGVTQRFIDISSPFSHAFVSENMRVVGAAEVDETFNMTNIPEGAEAERDWWDMFN